MRQWWWPLALYLFLSALYLVVVPLGESPDEPGHLQCIEQVAVLEQLPRVDPQPTGPWWQPGVTMSGRMCYHMPLYYLTAGLAQKAISALTATPVVLALPQFNERFPETGVMFLHPQRLNAFVFAEPWLTFGLRLISIALGAVVVMATVRVGWTIYPRDPLPGLIGATVVAGWPQFLFMSRAISNDMLVTALLSWLLVVLLRFGEPRRYVWAAVLSGLAVLTKITALYAPGLVVCLWLVEYWWRPQERSDLRKAGLGMVGIWAAGTLAMLAAPTIRDNLALSTRSFSGVNAQALTPEYWLSWFELSLSSGWARFGWMNVAPPAWTGWVWWLLIALLGAAGVHLWWRERSSTRCWLVVLLGLWIAGALFSYLRINLTVLQPQFRFLMSLLPIVAAFVGGGIVRLLPPAQPRRIAAWAGVAAGVIAINMWLVFGVIVPFYDI